MASPAELALAPEASLLAPGEPPAFEALPGNGHCPFLITCDHAGRRIPKLLGSLGLPEAELTRHIAWDLGAFQVARELARALGAFVITQTYSRLVIDCNRHPNVPSSIPELSEHTEIPGNQGLPAVAAQRRAREVFTPYHERIVQELDRRAQAKQPTVLIALHTFTPIFKGVPRPWHVGMLYNRDTRLARALLQRLHADPELVVGDNEPYSVSDTSDYGVPVYGEGRGIPHIEIEIRQDLVMTEAGQKAWAKRFAELLPEAYASLGA